MRKLIQILTILLFLNSCSNPSIGTSEELQFIKTINPAWINFYKLRITDFKIEKFELIQTLTKKDLIQGNIIGDFDTNFNKNHAQFLINSPDSSEYIDLDYYLISISKDEYGQLSCNGYDVDQEINWVNRKTQTIKRIGYNGTISRTEDAKWINSSNIVLFGTFEKTITLEFIDLST
jgi:hypothetical protein